MEVYKNVNWFIVEDIFGDLIDLVEILCKGRVEKYCINIVLVYLMYVLEIEKNWNFLKKYNKEWLREGFEGRESFSCIFFDYVLRRVRDLFMK